MPESLRRGDYWIGPAGHFFRVYTHIDAVCRTPDRFGLDTEDMYSLFQSHYEAIGHKDFAYESVKCALVQHGWIQVFCHARGGWIVRVARLDDRARRVLGRFFNILHDCAERFEAVKVVEMNSDMHELDVATVRDWTDKTGGDSPALTHTGGPEGIPDEAVVRVPLK